MKPLAISDNIKILSQRIEAEIDRISSDTTNGISNGRTDSLVYIGNWQDAIPRAIWVDTSLSAIDVRAWGIIRTQAVQGSAVMLSLNKLLASSLGYSNATVSRVLFVLRLTRWISLCSVLRGDTGRFKGNIYAIHDSPVSLDDAIYLDTGYLEFVQKQTVHSNKQIKQLAQTIWQNLHETIENGAEISQTSGISFMDQVVQNSLHVQKLNTDTHVYFLNMDENTRVQKLNPVGENNDFVENQQDNIHVQNLNVDSHITTTCSSSFLNTTTTDNFEIDFLNHHDNGSSFEPTLIFPNAFNDNEKQLAVLYLQKIDSALKQQFLDETAGQILQRKNTNNPIRNPIGFLSWLCNEHGKGNTYLTSAHLAEQKRRQKQAEQLRRERATDQAIKEQQKVLEEAAFQEGGLNAIKSVFLDEQKAKPKPKPKRNQRWEGLSHVLKPRN